MGRTVQQSIEKLQKIHREILEYRNSDRDTLSLRERAILNNISQRAKELSARTINSNNLPEDETG